MGRRGRPDADGRTELFVGRLRARSHIHGVAVRRVVELGTDPHIADHGGSGLDPDPCRSELYRRGRVEIPIGCGRPDPPDPWCLKLKMACVEPGI
jgi:hypothetical protein